MTNASKATHIEVDADVRYWEDATVNGVEDADGTLVFGREGESWRVSIDLASGRIEGWPVGMTARIHYKVCDAGLYWLTNGQGRRLARWKGGYVPNAYLCHGASGHGDYIVLDVMEDGHIEKYVRPDFDEDQWRDEPSAD